MRRIVFRKPSRKVGRALLTLLLAGGISTAMLVPASADPGTDVASHANLVATSDPAEGQPMDPNTIYDGGIGDTCGESDNVDAYKIDYVAPNAKPSQHWGVAMVYVDYRKGKTIICGGFAPSQRYIDLPKPYNVRVQYVSTKGKDKVLKQHTGTTDADTIMPVTLFEDGRYSFTAKKSGEFRVRVDLPGTSKNAYGTIKVKVKK